MRQWPARNLKLVQSRVDLCRWISGANVSNLAEMIPEMCGNNFAVGSSRSGGATRGHRQSLGGQADVRCLEAEHGPRAEAVAIPVETTGAGRAGRLRGRGQPAVDRQLGRPGDQPRELAGLVGRRHAQAAPYLDLATADGDDANAATPAPPNPAAKHVPAVAAKPAPETSPPRGCR